MHGLVVELSQMASLRAEIIMNHQHHNHHNHHQSHITNQNQSHISELGDGELRSSLLIAETLGTLSSARNNRSLFQSNI